MSYIVAVGGGFSANVVICFTYVEEEFCCTGLCMSSYV